MLISVRLQTSVDRIQMAQVIFFQFTILLFRNTHQLHQMPLAIGNVLPGILVKVGKVPASADSLETIKSLANINTCSVMNTINFLLHKQIIIKYNSLVVEYVKYSDAVPFIPLQLQVYIDNFSNTEITCVNLTDIVCY